MKTKTITTTILLGQTHHLKYKMDPKIKKFLKEHGTEGYKYQSVDGVLTLMPQFK